MQTIHRVYAQAEAAYRSEMEGIIADYGGEEYPYEDTRFYEQLCACTYQSGGVFSFVLHMEWFMGGVHNSSATGHTFDFNLGRELKIGDVLKGNDAQITAALENEFAAWYEEEMGEAEKAAVREQSGPDANFYLAEDGVHIFYMPYVVPATQNGADILIPWGSRLVNPANRPS